MMQCLFFFDAEAILFPAVFSLLLLIGLCAYDNSNANTVLVARDAAQLMCQSNVMMHSNKKDVLGAKSPHKILARW